MIFQLTVGDLQLGQLQYQRIAALEQRIEQLGLRAQLRFQNAALFTGERLAVRLANQTQLRLAAEQILIMQTLHPELRHLGIQLLRLRRFRQTGYLGAQGFAQQVGGAQPLRLFAQGIQRLAHLQRLVGRLTLLRGHQIHTLGLLVQRL